MSEVEKWRSGGNGSFQRRWNDFCAFGYSLRMWILYAVYHPSWRCWGKPARKSMVWSWEAKWSAMFSTGKCLWQGLNIIRDNSALKGRVTQTLAYRNSAQKHRASKRLFQSLGDDWLVLWYCTESEEILARKEVRTDVSRHNFLKTQDRMKC